MPTVRVISRQEWDKTHDDYKGESMTLLCRHCGCWVFESRPDTIPEDCTVPTGHQWDERRQKTMLAYDPMTGGTCLEFVEVIP